MKALRGLEPGIEALHVADLEHAAAPRHRGAQRLDLLDRGPDRLLAEHVFAGLERLQRSRDVPRVGGRDDDGLDLRVGEHGIVVGEGLLCGA